MTPIQSFRNLLVALLLALAFARPALAAETCGLYPAIAGVEGLPYCGAAHVLYLPYVLN